MEDEHVEILNEAERKYDAHNAQGECVCAFCTTGKPLADALSALVTKHKSLEQRHLVLNEITFREAVDNVETEICHDLDEEGKASVRQKIEEEVERAVSEEQEAS